MKDIMLYSPFNFLFIHGRLLVNKYHNIIEISGKKIPHFTLIA